MKEFTHIKPHYAKSQLDEIATYACLIANGTNLGIFKMANLCDLNYANLQTTEKNYLRLATIRAANNVVSNSIAKLSIFVIGICALTLYTPAWMDKNSLLNGITS